MIKNGKKLRRDQILFPEKERKLKRDVSELGSLVGEMLREQGGIAFYQRVERARLAAIARREGGTADDIHDQLLGLAPREAADMVRAFAAYFQMVNLAERIHRIRRRREYLRSESAPQPESIDAALLELRDGGVSLAELTTFLGDLVIEPVFTAHPTEAIRRTLLEKQLRIARHLVERLDPSLTPDEAHALLAQIRAEVTATWQTEEHPGDRITVADERENILFFITQVLYRIAPPFYEAFESAIARHFGELTAHGVPPILRFASWVGGDMDGNPNVSAATIEASLERHRELIIHRYRKEISDLAWKLSQSTHRVGVLPALEAKLDAYDSQFAGRVPPTHPRHHDMTYRRFLRLVNLRLRATRDAESGSYDGPAEFQRDIELVASSLRDNRGEHAGLFSIRRLLRRIQTFGFHLATLDVRQDSLVHREAIAVGLGRDDWLQLDAAERSTILHEALVRGVRPQEAGNGSLEPTLAVFAAIKRCRDLYGAQAIGPYIISMAQTADDVLSVLLLAKWGGLVDADGTIPLDVAPLFETVDDLNRGPAVMDELLTSPVYQPHLERRGNRQVIMIGYSDSNKDGGLAAARWALQQGQAVLADTLARHNVKIVFFHGRGGTISRGGGKVYPGVMAAPANTVQGRFRVTEQGEIINAKYGLRGIALRTLEQASAAVMLASWPGRKAEPTDAWHEVMDTLAASSRRAYRALVHDDPEFARYFRQSTPVDVIQRMRIGSRPASRRKGDGIDNLRAIPWVFAWTQSRQVFPGWYGIGSGLQTAIDFAGRDRVGEMINSWPFARNLIDDVEMVIAKADMQIARYYAELADPSLLHFFDKIRAEFQLTHDLIVDLNGTETLLDEDPSLQRSIYLRNPYVDTMSLVQVDLLRRWRATQREDDDLFQALLASVNGIALGLQNTG